MGSDTETLQKPLKSKRRRITRHDIKAIAGYVVEYRMNETEACLGAGISPKQWSLFKHRHKTSAMFEEMINSIRASNLRNCIGSINKAGDDREFETVTKKGEVVTITKPGDWRAKAWIAERILAPERLGQQQQSAGAVQVNVYAQLGVNIDDIGSKVYAERTKAKCIDVQATKMLQAPPNDKA